MPIYRNGKKITAIYHNNKPINEVYRKGHLVFTTKKGWVETGTIRYTINANSNNSVAGTIDFRRYDYYEGSSITKTYYEVSNRSLSRETEGVLTLTIPAGANLVFGSALNSAEYPVPTTGTITISASELANLYRINKNNGILNLTSNSIISYYLEPVQDMNISILGTGLYLNTGWAIANNRSSRIKTTTAKSVTELNLPSGDGMWPVYAVTSGGTDVEISTITCATTVHYTHDIQNMRHIGWVTVQNGNLTNVISYGVITSGDMSRQISGAVLTVNAGYTNDTSNCRVYVPSFTYDFTSMINAAKDSKTVGAYATRINYSGSVGSAGTTTQYTGGTNVVWAQDGGSYQGTNYGLPINGPCMLRFRNGPSGGTRTGCTISNYRVYTASDGSTYIDNPVSNITGSTWVEKEIPSGSVVHAIAKTSVAGSIKGSHTFYFGIQVATITEIIGTRQVTTVFAKVTRNQNNNAKTVSSQTSTGSSVPYVSYIRIGTITVERNASTGTLS